MRDGGEQTGGVAEGELWAEEQVEAMAGRHEEDQLQ